MTVSAQYKLSRQQFSSQLSVKRVEDGSVQPRCQSEGDKNPIDQVSRRQSEGNIA
jgi:hypothetical protein